MKEVVEDKWHLPRGLNNFAILNSTISVIVALKGEANA
jgi:hypothetical protein